MRRNPPDTPTTATINPIVTRRITRIATGLLIEDIRTGYAIRLRIAAKKSMLFKEAALLFVLLFRFLVGRLRAVFNGENLLVEFPLFSGNFLRGGDDNSDKQTSVVSSPANSFTLDS